MLQEWRDGGSEGASLICLTALILSTVEVGAAPIDSHLERKGHTQTYGSHTHTATATSSISRNHLPAVAVNGTDAERH